MKSGGESVGKTNLVKAECPVGVGEFDEQCYIRPEDYDTFFGRARMGADACPESMGAEACERILKAKKEEGDGWKKGHFGSGITGYGIGYYGSDEVSDGETLRRWHGLGVNMSASHRALTGLASLTASLDANLGFGDGIEANGGIGPAFSIGLPAIVRGWGAFKVRGNASSGGEGEGHTGWGLNPEAGLSVFFVDLRWIFPAVAGGGETQQGNSFFAGVSVGLP